MRDQIDARKVYLFLKRGMDIFIAILVILLVLSWLTPLMLILVTIDSRGPLFFVQRRVGRGGKSFLCYKFRTMVINTEKDKKPAGENDERITRIGKLLRQSNIDELPQFMNVLLGSMSIVGPRPHMFTDCYRFSTAIPGYKFRNMVKPGLTGLAQVKGYRGPANTHKSIVMRFQYDEQYIKNISFLLDSRILLQTAIQRIKAFIRFLFKQQLSPKRQAYKI